MIGRELAMMDLHQIVMDLFFIGIASLGFIAGIICIFLAIVID